VSFVKLLFKNFISGSTLRHAANTTLMVLSVPLSPLSLSFVCMACRSFAYISQRRDGLVEPISTTADVEWSSLHILVHFPHHFQFFLASGFSIRRHPFL
jgi:hypothetical protein